MALFKIYRGLSTDFTLDKVPLHDGYAYFTPDDGGFYIDAAVDGAVRRIKVNDSQNITVNNIGPDEYCNIELTASDIYDTVDGYELTVHRILDHILHSYVVGETLHADTETARVLSESLDYGTPLVTTDSSDEMLRVFR